jgi:hypothetical protein
MSSILDSKKLVATIKRRAFIPNDQVTFSEDDFLEMATEEINLGLMDQIIEARGDYLVDFIDVPLSITKYEYPIPDRAHGNKLRKVAIVDSTGEDVVERLAQISIDIPGDQRTSNSFYILNNKVCISKELAVTNNFLRLSFYMRPNKLVQLGRSSAIVSIVDNGDGTSSLSFNALPKHFSAQIKYDITGAKSPNKILAFDIVPLSLNLSTKVIVVPSTYAADISPGDYVTQAEETIVPNVPTEYHPVVAQRVAIACLEAMGDEQNKQSAERKLAQMEKSVLKIVSNRVEGQPKKIRQTNSPLLSSINRLRKF